MAQEPSKTEGEFAKLPVVKKFRKAHAPALSFEQSTRQTDVLRMASQRIAPSGAAIAFLNAHHGGLGGVPLHLAIESAEGLLRVEQHLARIGKVGSRSSNRRDLKS